MTLLSHDVTLPKDVTPEFPDQCVECGIEGPQARGILKVSRLPWFLSLFLIWIPFIGRHTVEFPLCDACNETFTKRRFQRRGLELLIVVPAGIVAYVLMKPLGIQEWPRLLRFLAIVAAIFPLLMLIAWFPPVFDVSMGAKNIDYEFEDARYAEAFEALNTPEEPST